MGHPEERLSTTSTRVDVAVVSGEPLWPPVHGGRLRSAGLVDGLSARFRLGVVAPGEGPVPAGLRGPDAVAGVASERLPAAVPLGRLEGFASPLPRLGAVALGRERLGAVGAALSRLRPKVVLYSHGYLAAVAPAVGVPVAVDFPDVEARRQASLARRGPARHRVLAAWEALKARRWEPRAARRVAVVSAVTGDDADLLASWGAVVVLVPNGSSATLAPPSPATGPVTFVAGLSHPPNADAARWLVDEVWPRLQAAEPELRLRLVGRAADRVFPVARWGPGIEVVADPETTDAAYAEAALVLAPVRRGGGAQLKVTEALARGRLVVATPFSAASAPTATGPGVVVADGAEETAATIVRLWRDVDERRRRERALRERRPVPSWEEACRPLADVLEALLRRR